MSVRRWTSGVAVGAMVLGATAFAPPPPAAVAAAGGHRTILTAPASTDPEVGAADDIGGAATRVRHARIDSAALGPLCGDQYGRPATFPLFDDVSIQLTEQSRYTSGGTLLWTGGVGGGSGQRGFVTLEGGCDGVPDNERMNAEFMLGGDVYTVETTGPGTVRISQVTPLTDENEPGLGTPPAGPRGAAADTAVTPRAAAACKGGQGITLIDLLIGYTPKATTEAGGDKQIRAEITRAVALANEAFAVSGTKARLRLVHVTPVKVTAAQDGVTQELIKAVAATNDKVADELHPLRDKYGADLVSVIAGGNAAGGLAYTPTAPSVNTSNYGFSVVARSALSHFSLVHEIGHNLGASHDRVTQPKQPPPRGANGYFPKSGNWSSLMAYESGCRKATKGRCGRINHFANAHETYRGEALGVPLGRPDEADTGEVFNTTVKGVAAYRAAKSTEALCGVTTSVSPKSSGTVAAARTGPYPKGTTAVFTAKPAKGYVFSHWILDGKRVAGTSATARVPVGFDRKLVAFFVKGKTPAPKVVTRTTRGGAVKQAPAAKAAAMGVGLLYSAVPEPGYHFVGWELGDSYAGDTADVGVDLGDEDLVLSATFAPAVHPLMPAVEGGLGTIEPSRPGLFAEGDTVIVTATPSRGYRFVGWFMDGKKYGGRVTPGIGQTAVTFGADSHLITARFAPVLTKR
ncbi:zinc-dependent metalloprotease family protein [Streptomyces sp. AM 4-1-1]|uniref:InlB B-repeat-containing protein n=1 Tax=Streptomyces sp. AM 4-1-1 TaxID=3028710 RepID=UPI0023B8E1E3|nr:zinc-dependent metalloprotease family protein [Streptomyces sp. AM 4-1-1]WEH36524.1 zinc-dependent metalloprotease family protein [Streptomyces sp. AM 4-1-1]